MCDINRLIHRGTGGQQGWIYDTDGLMSTIPSSCYKDPPKILVTPFFKLPTSSNEMITTKNGELQIE